MEQKLVIQSQFDQLPLDIYIKAPNNPIGIIQLSHGICEHKERYFHFIDFLVKHHYICVIHDHRGHGHSIRKTEDLGYFYKDGHIGIVEDCHQVTLWIKQQFPSLPIYLFGHSMGSLVARCYLKKYSNDIDGLILCGSPSYQPMVSVGICLCQIMQKFYLDHCRPALIQKLVFGSYVKSNIPNDWICNNPAVVHQYNNDPLCAYTLTLQGFESLFRLLKETYKNNYSPITHDIPIHFIAGEDDPCIINQKAFLNAVKHLQNQGYSHISFRLFAGMKHEILNEKNNDIVYKHILDKIKTWQ